MSRRYCRKCAIEKEEKLYQSDLKEYVKNIDEDIKAAWAVYEKRLELCTSCEKYMGGMCRICGCFVEMRAAVRNNKCPLKNSKW